MVSLNFTIVALFILTTLISFIGFTPDNRWKPLLITSIAFYYLLVGYKIVIILYLALVSYHFGLAIAHKNTKLIVSITLVIAPLIVSKSLSTLNHFDNYQLINLKLVEVKDWKTFFSLLGLSYISFNSISYLVDIKRRYIEPEQSFFRLMLYLLFFPTAFSGPLHRYKHLSRQFKRIEISNESVSNGLRLVLFGAFKMMISTRIFQLVVGFETSSLSGVYYLGVGTCFFFFLFFSFSSLIDIVQGASLLIGINVKSNFHNRIYFATSRQEFWRGWHITLNEWFRDYFFFPLAKKDKRRKYTDFFLLLTFICIALWHGFTSSLLVWGLGNGVWIILEKKIKPKATSSKSIYRVLGLVYHLSLSSLLALIFISSNFGELFQRLVSQPTVPQYFIEQFGIKILVLVICVCVADYHNYRAKDNRFDRYLHKQSTIYRWAVYLKLILLIMIFGINWDMNNYYNQF